MLNILIADDERLIRDGLKMLLDAQNGMRVTAAVCNGEEALEAARRERPHVVLTDIRMPGMDGLALIRALHGEFPGVRKVVVSGYEDFGYAQETMKYGAIDYLLKPVDEAELIALMRRIAAAVLDEERARSDGANMLDKLNLGLPLLREDFLRALLRGDADMDEEWILKRLEYLGVELDGQVCRALAVTISGEQPDVSALKTDVERALPGIARVAACVHENAVAVAVPLGSCPPEPGLLAQALLDGLPGDMSLRAAVGVGCAVMRLADLPASWAAARQALEGRFLNEDIRVFVADELRGEHPSGCPREILNGFAGRFNADAANAAELMRGDSLLALLEEARAFLTERRAVRSDALKLFTGMVSLLLAGNAEFKRAVDELYGSRYLYFEALEAFDTLGGIVRYTGELCGRAVSRMLESRATGDGMRMKAVREYIDENYMRPVSLSTLSGMLYVNPNYFCEMFKAATGENFVDYLTRVRVEKAKALLKDPRVKTYEVGALVGYEDSGYFCKVFKKLVGVTPGAYRRSC